MFSINAPTTIQPKSEYNIIATLHEGKEPATFKFQIEGGELNLSKEVEVQPRATNFIKFEIPDIPEASYLLTSQGVNGVYFKKVKALNYSQEENLFVNIQTDKSVYKPGDLLRFRALFIDAKTRPVTLDQAVSLTIHDGSNNIIMQNDKVQVIDGVYSDTYTLTDVAETGLWKIQIKEKSKTFDHGFEVQKYVLPKFHVDLNTPKTIYFKDKTMNLNLTAKSTYGKPIQGLVNFKVSAVSYHRRSKVRNNWENSMDINGKGAMTVDLSNLIDLEDNEDVPYELEVSAEVTDKLTKCSQTARSVVHISRMEYNIYGVDIPQTYKPNESLLIRIAVNRVEIPVIDQINAVILTVKSNNDDYDEEEQQDSNQDIKEYSALANEKGIAEFEINLCSQSNKQTAYVLEAKYLEHSSHIRVIHPYVNEVTDDITLTLKKNVENDQEVVVLLKSKKPLDSIIYHIIVKGNIIKSQLVDTVPENNFEYSWRIHNEASMLPKADLFVFVYEDGNLHQKSAGIEFENRLPNMIKIEAEDEAGPGNETILKVKTEPNSFVGLLGVDQSVLILKEGNDLTADKVLGNFNTYPRNCYRPYGSSDIIILTNADLKKDHNRMIGGCVERCYVAAPMMMKCADMLVEPSVRDFFPETWIWDDLENVDAVTEIRKVVPDTITSWVLTGFSLNKSLGLGITKDATKLKAYKPFFASASLPYSVKRGEIVTIPVIVYNYLDRDLNTAVCLENSDDEFEFVELEEQANEVTKTVNVATDIGAVVNFVIRPKVVGQIKLKIKAISEIAGDIIHQYLKVVPEGITEYLNKSLLVNCDETPQFNHKVNIEIPQNAVPDSEVIELSVIGNLLGPTIINIDKLVRKPYGCGEQNMVNFVPNILVLDYLTTMNILTKPLERKAKKFLEAGYQRQLKFAHDDGSFSAFGRSDANGSTWLTAYVIRSFQKAKKFTYIQESVLSKAIEFLISKQLDSGRFEERGKLFDYKDTSKEDNGVALTAFVLIALLEHGNTNQSVIDKALNYIKDNIKDTKNICSLVISAYAFAIAKSDFTPELLKKINEMSNVDGVMKSWTVEETVEEKEDLCYYRRPSSRNVEITSYAYLAFSHSEDAHQLLPIIKWIISQRNSHGGFESTQDTVMGLEALTHFAKSMKIGNGEIEINFTDDLGATGKLNVNEANALLLQSHLFGPKTREITLDAKGSGTALVQVSYRFNKNDSEKAPAFSIEANKVSVENGLLKLSIEAKYNGEKSNMAVMEVNFPSGFVAELPADIPYVKKTEKKDCDTVLVIYFDCLTTKKIKFEVSATQIHDVKDCKPSAIVLYDYYDSSKTANIFYNCEI